MSLQVKICGVTRVEDALAAAEAGADMIGLNFWPGTPRCVSADRAREIVEAVQGRAEPVAVFVDAARDEIVRTASELGIRTVQLHGSETAELARSLPDLEVIKAFHICEQADLNKLEGFPAQVYLLDARGGAMPGGTGRVADWRLARLASRYGRILLAGGLNPENVADAVRTAKPWGVDTASGVETEPGIKDRQKMELFVANARKGGGR